MGIGDGAVGASPGFPPPVRFPQGWNMLCRYL
jgi:hypothetical protein